MEELLRRFDEEYFTLVNKQRKAYALADMVKILVKLDLLSIYSVSVYRSAEWLDHDFEVCVGLRLKYHSIYRWQI